MLKKCLVVAVLTSMIAVTGYASQKKGESHKTTTPALMPGTYFIELISPGPKWNKSKSRDDQTGMAGPRAYMGSLFDGPMIIGGPFVDTVGGLAVLKVGTADEARKIADADPGVRGGILKYDIRQWRMAIAGM